LLNARHLKANLFLLTGLILSFSGYTQVKLPGIFGDHMVIQRDQPVPLWGWASPREKLLIKFNKQSKEIKADDYGKWKLTLDPEPAGGPYELRIGGSNIIIYHDVLVGEVWLCSGQSNMEFEVKSARNADEEIQAATFPEIRHIKIVTTVSGTPKEDILPSRWDICSAKTAGNFTAVGYYFAREMVKRLHVPVGLINSTWGGTMVETWTSRGAFEQSPEFRTLIDSMPDKDFDALMKERRIRLEEQIRLLQKNISDRVPEEKWKNPDYNSQAWPKISVAVSWENQPLGLGDLDGTVWYRKEVILSKAEADRPVTLSLGTIDDFDETFVNGIWVGSTKNWDEKRVYHIPAGVFKEGKNLIAVRVEDTGGGGGFYGDSSAVKMKTENGILQIGGGWRFRIAKISDRGIGMGPNDFPSLLFNAMIHPLIPFGIRGVLWYQGEANADRAYQYRKTFPLMIEDWRRQWGEGNFPFYFVQLASFNYLNGNSERGSSWAELREAQSNTLRLPATGMALTLDIGESNDIHPKNKQDVGLRLAAIALNNVYGQTRPYSGPVYQSMNIQGNKVLLRFAHTGSGLIAKDKYGYLKGFEIAGPDHHFHYAKACIQENQVVVFADEVKLPLSVRYAWADDAGDANLYNREGFPAVPFRTDQWKGLTDERTFKIGK
jgi:sialate O-acetylesterase